MEYEDRPGYYAIIPANVRYDDNIPANAKLLYGEISALIGSEGFCFASNQYFADIYGLTPVTVARLVSKLEEAGYIKRELEKDTSGQVVRRKLYLSVSMPEIQPLNNFDNTPQQNCGEGIIKNDKDTNTSNTVSIEGKGKRAKSMPLTDEQLQAQFIDWIKSIASETWDCRTKNVLYSALCGFYAPRESKKQEPAHTQAGFTALGNKLVRDSGKDPVVMIGMLEQATISGWKSVYPPKGGTTPKPPTERRDEEWL